MNPELVRRSLLILSLLVKDVLSANKTVLAKLRRRVVSVYRSVVLRTLGAIEPVWTGFHVSRVKQIERRQSTRADRTIVAFWTLL